MPNFANGKTSINVTPMGQHAMAVARQDGRSITNVQAIDQSIIDSMTEQGMTGRTGWSPGTPIDPMQPLGSEPRAWEYMIGQNIVQRPRSTENISFDTIRSIIEMYDIAQMCIEVRQDELRNLEWDIVPVNEDDASKYDSEIKAVRAFFEKPDGYILFDDFQNKLAYDWLAFDAPTIFPHLTKGGKLGALEVIDGSTITPLVDWDGRTPQSPAPAFVQYAYGMPWVWLTRDQLIYRPHRLRSNKLYGYPPVEWLLNNINTDIRYQLYFLQWFTDGSIPDTWINGPRDMNAKQLKEFQDMYDAVMTGDQTQKHKAKMIPADAKIWPAKKADFSTEFPTFMMTKTCAAYKVQPSEIGFTEKVNKSSGESQENVQYRRSIKPSAMFFSSIYTGIVQKYFGMPNLKFKYLNLEEQEDLLMMAQRDDIYIKDGVMSPDEVRVKRLGLDVDAKNPVPRVFVTSSGIMAVDDALAQSKAAAQPVEPTEPVNPVEPAPIDEDPNKVPTTPKDKQVLADTQAQEDAKKAVMDFFYKSGDGDTSSDVDKKIDAWTEKLAPEILKFLTKQGKAIAKDIKKRLESAEKMAKDAAENSLLTAAELAALQQKAKEKATAIIAAYESNTWTPELVDLLNDPLVAIYLESMDDAAAVVATIQSSFAVDESLHQAATDYAEKRTAELVTKLDQSTRDMLRSDLSDYMNQGLTPKEIATNLQDNYAFSETRATTIAQTETGFAYNDGTLTTYNAAGYDKVTVYDGDYDEDCQVAQGQIWTLGYAREHPKAHPRCRRNFGLCTDPDAVPDKGGDDNTGGETSDDEED